MLFGWGKGKAGRSMFYWEILLYGDFEPKKYREVIVKQIAKYKLEKQVKIIDRERFEHIGFDKRKKI